ncbi:MAG TPA: twin-arginine translocase subunit TatC [Bacteroidales bacterium]|nr:twin-arginine translocase subunit TatC [Bacteroidales bacterium]
MQELTFWDHIEVLRHMLFRVLGVMFLASIAFFIFMPQLFDQVIMAPCFGDFPIYRLFCDITKQFTNDTSFCDESFQIQIINIRLAAQFMIHMQMSFLLGLIVSFPYVLFEIWKFIAPALYDKEKNSFRLAFSLSSILFYSGVSLSYFVVFPITLRFLAGYQITSLVSNQLSLDSYISNFITLNLIMGLVFELPMLALILSKLGIVKRHFFSKYRKHAIIVLLILAAVITPTGDPFTLLIVALPLYILYEISAILVKK